MADVPAAPTSHGIQALIDRLRDEGIVAGRAQAGELLEAARREIDTLRAAAHREAEALLERAREQVRLERETALGAVRLALRDAVLQLEEEFLQLFAERLQRRVHDQLADPALLRRVLESLLLASGRNVAIAEADLEALALDNEARLLADGVELAASAGGVRLVLRDDEVEVDVGDGAVTALLLSHLLPRVRHHIADGPDAAVGQAAAGQTSG
jgi:V/A-type H+-transporting ATPase subunit E